VIARELKQPEGRGLFLVSPASTDPETHGDNVPHARLRLRTWETRRAWAGRTLIALSFPMAYLLIMHVMGSAMSIGAARILIWAWVGALAVASVCAEAAWRNRMKLEQLEDIVRRQFAAKVQAAETAGSHHLY
jgi:hypothetical protein